MSDDSAKIASLVAAAADGDQGAWNELVDRFAPLLIAVLLRYELSRAEMQDVAQTVWLRLVEHLDELREPRCLPGWLATTARREAIRALRAVQRTQVRDPLDPTWTNELVTEDDPTSLLERGEQRQALLAGFASLNSRQQHVLILLAQDPPVTYAEISRRTGVPVGAIGPTRSRALDRLRQEPSVQALLVGAAAGGDGHEW